MKFEENEDLSKFLETAIKDIYSTDPIGVAMMYISSGGQVTTHYFNCMIPTKLLFSAYMNQDAMIERLEINKAFLDIDDFDTQDLDS